MKRGETAPAIDSTGPGSTPDRRASTEEASTDASASQVPAESQTADTVASFDGRVLRLRGTIDIYQAQELRLQLIEIAAAPPENLVIDLSELVRLDAAAAQVILAFRRELPQLHVLSPPESVRDALVGVGIWKLL